VVELSWELCLPIQAIPFEGSAHQLRNPAATDALTDARLLQLSRRGDENAFVTLYRRHQAPVFRFALHMSGNRETAEEITQEVFLAMLTGAQQYVPERGPLQGYLIGVARNCLRRELRGIRPIPSDEMEAIGNLRGESGEQLIDELSREQEVAALRSAILSLPPNYREVVVLCDLEGTDYAQAAEQLGCAVGTVRSRLHRARSILKAKLRRTGDRKSEGAAWTTG